MTSQLQDLKLTPDELAALRELGSRWDLAYCVHDKDGRVNRVISDFDRRWRNRADRWDLERRGYLSGIPSGNFVHLTQMAYDALFNALVKAETLAKEAGYREIINPKEDPSPNSCAVEEKFKEVSLSLTGLDKRLNDLESKRLGELESQVEGLSEKLDELESRLDNAEVSVDSIDVTIDI